MMTEDYLTYLRAWFVSYCQSFYSCDDEDQRNILLKEEHTHRVCANIIRIAAAEGLPEDRLLLAEVTALLHDVGRFEQYRQYRTFRDSMSVNHATLGTEIIRQADLLKGLFPHDRDVVYHAVEYHNAFRVPGTFDGDRLFFLRLVRDADKLDIWRVFMEYYAEPEERRSSVVGLGFPDRPECSPVILEQVANGEVVLLSSVKTLNDFKLLQLSWVYDLTFPASFRLAAESGVFSGIAATLPDNKDVHRAVSVTRDFIRMNSERTTAFSGMVQP